MTDDSTCPPGMSAPPTYAEAVSEEHRPGHTPIWESCTTGRACKLCGFIEPQVCGWWSGPAWKCDGETCVCNKPKGHSGDDVDHECSCGTWFAGNGLCGHPPEYRKSDEFGGGA